MTAAAGAAAALHRITKPVEDQVQHIWKQGVPLVCPLQRVEAKRADWAEVWLVGHPIQTDTPRPWESAPLEELPPLQLDAFEVAFRQFKVNTGVGCNLLHPKDPLPLGPGAKTVILRFLEAIERSRTWPDHSSVLNYWLIPKSNGKDRPLALLPTLIRWWEFLRYPIVLAWEKDHIHEWDATHSGKGAEHAAWHALLQHEAVDMGDDGPEQEAQFTLVMDLVKAFEKVQLYQVWCWAEHFGFPRATSRS